MTDLGIGNNLNYGGMQLFMNGLQSMPYMPYQSTPQFTSAFTPWAGVPYSFPQYGTGMFDFNPMFTFGGTSSSSSSNGNKYLTTEEFYKQQKDDYNKSVQNTTQTTTSDGPTEKEWEILAKDYAKGLSPSESLAGTCASTAVMAPVFGAGKVKRAISQGGSGKEIKETIKTCEEAKGLYGKMDGNKLAREVAENLRKLEEMAKREKATIFRSKCDTEVYNKALEATVNAMKTGNLNELAIVNEQIKQATVKNNWFSRTWRSLRGIAEPSVNPSEIFNRTGNETAVKAAEKSLGLAEGALKEVGSSATRQLTAKTVLDGVTKHAGGAAFMAGIEVLMKIPDIRIAFEKDSATGWKQIGQTSVKAAGNAVGWIAGEAAFTAASTWAIAEICAATGTAIAPGVGTAIGFVVGMIGGAIGCWLAGKATNAIVGDDVANEVRAENKLKEVGQTKDGKTAEVGKEEILQNAISMHGTGKASPEVEQILRKYKFIQAA